MTAADKYDVKFGKGTKSTIHYTILAEGLTIELDTEIDFDFVTEVSDYFYQMNNGTDGTGGLIPMIKVVEKFIGPQNYRLFKAAAKKNSEGVFSYQAKATGDLFQLCLEKIFPKVQDWVQKESEQV